MTVKERVLHGLLLIWTTAAIGSAGLFLASVVVVGRPGLEPMGLPSFGLSGVGWTWPILAFLLWRFTARPEVARAVSNILRLDNVSPRWIRARPSQLRQIFSDGGRGYMTHALGLYAAMTAVFVTHMVLAFLVISLPLVAMTELPLATLELLGLTPLGALLTTLIEMLPWLVVPYLATVGALLVVSSGHAMRHAARRRGAAPRLPENAAALPVYESFATDPREQIWRLNQRVRVIADATGEPGQLRAGAPLQPVVAPAVTE